MAEPNGTNNLTPEQLRDPYFRAQFVAGRNIQPFPEPLDFTEEKAEARTLGREAVLTPLGFEEERAQERLETDFQRRGLLTSGPQQGRAGQLSEEYLGRKQAGLSQLELDIGARYDQLLLQERGFQYQAATAGQERILQSGIAAGQTDLGYQSFITQENITTIQGEFATDRAEIEARTDIDIAEKNILVQAAHDAAAVRVGQEANVSAERRADIAAGATITAAELGLEAATVTAAGGVTEAGIGAEAATTVAGIRLQGTQYATDMQETVANINANANLTVAARQIIMARIQAAADRYGDRIALQIAQISADTSLSVAQIHDQTARVEIRARVDIASTEIQASLIITDRNNIAADQRLILTNDTAELIADIQASTTLSVAEQNVLIATINGETDLGVAEINRLTAIQGLTITSESNERMNAAQLANSIVIQGMRDAVDMSAQELSTFIAQLESDDRLAGLDMAEVIANINAASALDVAGVGIVIADLQAKNAISLQVLANEGAATVATTNADVQELVANIRAMVGLDTNATNLAIANIYRESQMYDADTRERIAADNRAQAALEFDVTQMTTDDEGNIVPRWLVELEASTMMVINPSTDQPWAHEIAVDRLQESIRQFDMSVVADRDNLKASLQNALDLALIDQNTRTILQRDALRQQWDQFEITSIINYNQWATEFQATMDQWEFTAAETQWYTRTILQYQRDRSNNEDIIATSSLGLAFINSPGFQMFIDADGEITDRGQEVVMALANAYTDLIDGIDYDALAGPDGPTIPIFANGDSMNDFMTNLFGALPTRTTTPVDPTLAISGEGA